MIHYFVITIPGIGKVVEEVDIKGEELKNPYDIGIERILKKYGHGNVEILSMHLNKEYAEGNANGTIKIDESMI